MATSDIYDRLRELGLYSEYYHRLEIKPLSKMLNIDEKLLCILTGVNSGQRKMLAVTNYRLIVIGAGVLAGTEVKVISRNAVVSWKFDKRFLLSSASFSTKDELFEFRQTQGARKTLFEEAMESPITAFEN